MAWEDPQWITIFDGSTGTGDPVACNTSEATSFEMEWPDGASAGEVVIEFSSAKDYTGTWAEITTQAFVDDGKHLLPSWPGPAGFFRVRVTDNVVGGNVVVRKRSRYR